MKRPLKMTDPVQIPAEEIRQCLDEESLRDWVQHQRWYASKSRAVTGIEVVEGIVLSDDPILFVALVQTRFATGTHELYQLPLALRAHDEPSAPKAIAQTADWTVYDALAEPERLLELMRKMDSGDEIEATDGRFSFHRADGIASLSDDSTVRLMGVEQSNSSLVIDDQLVLKVFRKLEAGINPELELLRFLTAAASRTSRRSTAGMSTRARRCPRRSALRSSSSPTPSAAGSSRSSGSRPTQSGSSTSSRTSAGSRRGCTMSSPRCGRPGVLARGAQPGGAVAADGDGRRGHRADLRAAPR